MSSFADRRGHFVLWLEGWEGVQVAGFGLVMAKVVRLGRRVGFSRRNLLQPSRSPSPTSSSTAAITVPCQKYIFKTTGCFFLLVLHKSGYLPGLVVNPRKKLEYGIL